MKLFLLDLWHDLREKRLWPVALALAVALIAVPVVLSKPAAEPAAPPPAPSQPQADRDLQGLAKVVLADQETGKGSKLNLFESSDPFRPPKSAQSDEAAADTGAPASGGAAGPAPDTSGGGGGSVDFFAFGPSGGSGGGGGGAPTTPSQPDGGTKTTQFTYVIDLTFISTKDGNSDTRRIKGMKRLEMLPNDESPLLVFLGVDAKANNAVFLVDSRLNPSGEGKCKPSTEDCSFLYLGAGAEHFFTDENSDAYTLRIDQIRRVKVSSKAKGAKAKAGRHKRSRKRGRGRGRKANAATVQRAFVPPLLVDLVTVSSDRYEGSSGPSTGR